MKNPVRLAKSSCQLRASRKSKSLRHCPAGDTGIACKANPYPNPSARPDSAVLSRTRTGGRELPVNSTNDSEYGGYHGAQPVCLQKGRGGRGKRHLARKLERKFMKAKPRAKPSQPGEKQIFMSRYKVSPFLSQSLNSGTVRIPCEKRLTNC